MKELTFNIRGSLKQIQLPCIMGILNLTDDSFYPGSRISSEKQLIETADKMIQDGAAILDVGAVSTRPGSLAPDIHYEQQKIVQAIRVLRKNFPNILISVDTFRSVVAQSAANEGADIINDVSAGTLDDSIFKIAANEQLPVVLMHMQGTPLTMQNNPHYDNLLNDIIRFLAERIDAAEKNGIKDIIVDPGFGFGKTIEHNFEILAKLSLFKILNKPILVGLSRKSMIYRTIGSGPEDALNGTTVLHTIALLRGADILRVHDVKHAVEVIQLLKHVHHAENDF